MKELIQIIADKTMTAFEKEGFEKEAGKVGISNRPDLCQYQCNGAMALAKSLHKNPMEIAEKVASLLGEDDFFKKAEAVKPGFINIDISDNVIQKYLADMSGSEHLSLPQDDSGVKMMIDYGGPNVAKPLHIGHLRAAIIGESIKRIYRSLGYDIIGDVHLGDWGQQMGLIINELKERKPNLPYFDPDFKGEFPKEAPFTLSELEEIYPYASSKSKEPGNEEYKAAAMEATNRLQQGDKAYNAILKHILELSITDLKKNYSRLKVDFDLWKGESDAAPYIKDMVEKMKKDGYAYESNEALVVDVAEESDTKEVPPCMILKSDGAALYNTTDLATLVYRMKDYNPAKIIYVVDKRQSLYFTQVFRCAKKTGIVPQSTELVHVGFGTMNGKDGKPFKTREGGVMRLSSLLDDLKAACLEKIETNDSIPKEEMDEIADKIALAAIKYGDLSNAPSKDYIFDEKKFIAFEGNTGPYILYTIVRIKSILRKYSEQSGKNIEELSIKYFDSDNERTLALLLSRFNSAVLSAKNELSPSRICGYIYELSNAFNSFYHETKILSCEDETQKEGYISLLNLTLKVLEKSIDILGFDSPERM